MIKAANQALTQAVADRDGAAAAALCGDTATLLPPGSDMVHGRPEIERFWRTGIEIGLASIELCPVAIQHQAAVVYQLGRYRIWVEPAESKPVSDQGTYVVIHERRLDGSWEWAVAIFNPTTHEPSPIRSTESHRGHQC